MPVRDPPYPVTTNVGSSKFQLDSPRIEQSSTWVLAPAELRPWLLMLWFRAWRQLPSGSFPDDDAVIAAHIGMPLPEFGKQRKHLMRGWYKADDGRLYHETISGCVHAVLTEREEWRKRNAKRSGSNTPDTRVLPASNPPVSRALGLGLGVGVGVKASTSHGLSNTVARDSDPAGTAKTVGEILSNRKPNGNGQPPHMSREAQIAAAGATQRKPNGNGAGSPPALTQPPKGWERTEQGIEAAAKALHLPALKGETWNQLKGRCFDALKLSRS